MDTKNYRRMKHIPVICFGIAGLLTSCSVDDGYTAQQRAEAAFQEQLKGEVSSSQWWRTTVNVQVQVTTDEPVKLWLMSSEQGGTLYDYRETSGSGMVTLTAPQGQGQTLYLVSECQRTLSSQTLTLTGKLSESLTLNTPSSSAAPVPGGLSASAPSGLSEASRAAVDRSSLYGSSMRSDAVYYEFSADLMRDYYSMMNKMSQEGVNAKTGAGLNCDYELESNGPFSITWVAGNCMSRTSHVLGYYYHSPGTYSDIQYVDVSETEVFDYIDGLAKVQYQVDDAAAQEHGVLANYWYDANFDMNDTWDKISPIAARQGDDAYNIMAAYKRYGQSLTALRGISFTIDVPKGKRIGFYDRWETQPAPEQYDRLVRYGVQPYTSREKFKGTSYSAEGMNSFNSKGNFRSFIEQHPNVTWMGLENDCTGGDLDCNDVIFGVTAELEIYKPSIVEPDLRPKGEYDDCLPWTIAYEDVGREPDYDFNDAVILLRPNYESEECCVTVMAAGSTSRMYLHYDGPDGDQNLGEIHELLQGSADTRINTANSMASTPFVEVACVKWPKSYAMQTDARRFYIEIQRGTCGDCTDVITLADEPGRMPEALLVAGKWNWPREGVNICNAYNIFPLWATDNTKRTYWSWYQSSQSGQIVSY